MNTFNFQRFGKVCVRLLLLRRGLLMKWGLTTAAIVFLFSALSAITWLLSSGYRAPIWTDSQVAQVVALALFSMGSTIAGTFIISDLEDKQSRMFELALPATHMEKFASRVLFTLIALPLVLLAGIAIADLAQQLLSLLINHSFNRSILANLNDNGPRVNLNSSFLLFLLAAINTNAVSVLGGVFYRKTAWLKTGLSLFVISMLLSILGTIVGFFLAYNPEYEFYIPGWMQHEIVPNLFLFITASCFYWLAFRIFKRVQVINNRFINI